MTFTSDEIAQCFVEDSSRWEQLSMAYVPRELEIYTWTSAKLIELSSRPTMAEWHAKTRYDPVKRAQGRREAVSRCLRQLTLDGCQKLRIRRRRASKAHYERLRATPRNLVNLRPEIACATCGDLFQPSRSHQRRCSTSCRDKAKNDARRAKEAA